MKKIILFLILLIVVSHNILAQSYNISDKPYTRYWWFASKISEDDVRYNLNWLRDHGFGGVELAWVYPMNRFNPGDTNYTPRQEWLSPEWSKIVHFTAKYADSIGLGCDMTFGTLWPFGDTKVKYEEATQKFGDPTWRQQIKLSWEYPKVGYVIDHLTPKNYLPYFNRLLKAFPRPKSKLDRSFFIDSWEVETEKLWCDNFDKDFVKKYGYDITKFMDSIYRPAYKMQLFDYMSLVSEKVVRFYKDFDSALNSAGVLSRGQVSGAPCDLISGYSILDIPEGESMLFEPEFCAIPSSAAALSGKSIVSSETFTCIYGWPRDYLREEQAADLKLVADALFANGINHIIWHGKPHNKANSDSTNFYATTHIGTNSFLNKEIKQFNFYLEKVQTNMRLGNPYFNIAVYLPTEDAWIKGVMPKELQFKWAWGYYEMRYVYFPDELKGFNNCWVNNDFLTKSKVINGKIHIGSNIFEAVYINSDYVSNSTIKELLRIANEGGSIILKKIPSHPGYVSAKEYKEILEKLLDNSNVHRQVPIFVKPFIVSENKLKFYTRKDKDTYYIFFANPLSNSIKFPMEYGQSFNNSTYSFYVGVNIEGRLTELSLRFKPYQSLLYKIKDGVAEQINIEFIPSTPTVKKRPSSYLAPWLVK